MPRAMDLRSAFPVLERTRLPERGHRRAGAAAGDRRRECPPRRGARARPLRRAPLDRPARAARPPPRGAGRAAPLRRGRGRAHPLDHRRRQHRAVRARPARGRRGDHERPGAPRPARARWRPPAIRHGITIKVVPFASVADAVSERTRLVACSHVSWVNGSVVDTAALRATGVSVLLDGAQGLGAVPVDVARARLRLLRRLGPEVALRPRRHRLPVRAGRAHGGAQPALARLPVPRGPARPAVAAPPPRRPPLRPRLPDGPLGGLVARLDRAARGRRLGPGAPRGATLRRPAGRLAARSAASRWSRAGARRSWPGTTRTPRRA